MNSSAMATRFAFGLTLFASPILAATIELSAVAAHLAQLSAASAAGTVAAASSAAGQYASLDGEALVELSAAAHCPLATCLAADAQSVAPPSRLPEAAKSALSALDEELLELFTDGAIERSDLQGLFWRMGLPITDR
jgi:hypothetical protein